ncbi:MAG TPA: 3-isopropylmalate dehydratase large subunit [Bacteroidota bacterium]|jgi:3-isopropylmalate/(R)-2-methylmalate dehydratase large subunit|nr:3-isopropylmalate dehydratase large subunit [Bacteroidota bacterium]
MTITEKILARSARKSKLSPGENVWLNVDILMTHDVCGPPTINIWKKEFGNKAKIWDKKKLVILPDHYIFTSNKEANRNVKFLQEFARQEELPFFYDITQQTYKGVCHVALAEEGFNIPGTVIFGTDSHTCTSGAFGLFSTGVGNTDAAFILGTGKIWERVPESIKIIYDGALPKYLTGKDLILWLLKDITTEGANYKALEFTGSAISQLSMDERMTLTNMAIETGAINGIIAVDDITKEYLKDKVKVEYEEFKSDPDSKYFKTIKYDITKMLPIVAKPHSPDNCEVAHRLKNIKITKAYIGSCTGGKLSDFVSAAKILYGNKIKVPLFAIPATTRIEKELESTFYKMKPIKEILIEAGCTIARPSCAACLGGPEDTTGRAIDGDVVISTTNRNFPGRMGSKKSEVYLASPYTAAASAINGFITDPRDFL